jgi:hypothetical protein
MVDAKSAIPSPLGTIPQSQPVGSDGRSGKREIAEIETGPAKLSLSCGLMQALSLLFAPSATIRRLQGTFCPVLSITTMLPSGLGSTLVQLTPQMISPCLEVASSSTRRSLIRLILILTVDSGMLSLVLVPVVANRVTSSHGSPVRCHLG